MFAVKGHRGLSLTGRPHAYGYGEYDHGVRSPNSQGMGSATKAGGEHVRKERDSIDRRRTWPLAFFEVLVARMAGIVEMEVC